MYARLLFVLLLGVLASSIQAQLEDPWQPIIDIIIDASELENIVVGVGTEDGLVFVHTNSDLGELAPFIPLPIASSSKWLTAATIMQLVLDETISPQTGIIDEGCNRLTYQRADTPGALWQVDLATARETILFDETHAGITSRTDWYGSRVVFAGVVNDVEGLYMRDVSADDPALLLRGGKVDHPQWSPDGERIAFTLVDADGVADLALINADGSGFRWLTETPGTIEFDIDWSPDGRALVYTATVIRTTPPQLHILALADDDEPSIGRPILPDYYGSSAPDWGVNGIAFTGAQATEPSNLRKYIYDPDSETVRTITAVNKAMYARWSPDGRWLALRGWVDDAPRANVYVVDAATDTIQWEAPHEPNDSLRWSADGAYLAFDYLDEGWQVATLAMATGRVQRWGEGRNPDWRDNRSPAMQAGRQSPAMWMI